jgi:hypothetical protein
MPAVMLSEISQSPNLKLCSSVKSVICFSVISGDASGRQRGPLGMAMK